MTCAGVLRRRRGVCSQTRRAPVGATMTDFRRISRHRPWAAAGWRGRGWQCSSFPRLVTGGQHHVSGGGQVPLSVHPAPRTRHAALLLRQQPGALRTPPPPSPAQCGVGIDCRDRGRGGAGRVASHCNLVPISRQLGPGLSVMCTVSAEQRSLQRSYAAQVCKQLSPPHQPSSP